MRFLEDCPAPPGTVGVLTGELGRYSIFFQCLDRLIVPKGSTTYWPTASAHSVAKNSNRAILLAANQQSEWIWLIGDDHTFDPDIILRLLAHDVDVVCPINMHRNSPFMPIVLTPNPADKKYMALMWEALPQRGLISEIDGHPIMTGQAGMLIRRKVWEAIEGPYWFEFGRFVPDEPGEDLWFSKKILEAGFKIWLDCGQTMGHSNVATMQPRRTPDGWHVEFGMGGVFLHARVAHKRIDPVGVWQEPDQRLIDDCTGRIMAQLTMDPTLATLPPEEARRLVLERVLKGLEP